MPSISCVEYFACGPPWTWGKLSAPICEFAVISRAAPFNNIQVERDRRRKEARDAVRRQIEEALKEKEDLVKVG